MLNAGLTRGVAVFSCGSSLTDCDFLIDTLPKDQEFPSRQARLTRLLGPSAQQPQVADFEDQISGYSTSEIGHFSSQQAWPLFGWATYQNIELLDPATLSKDNRTRHSRHKMSDSFQAKPPDAPIPPPAPAGDDQYSMVSIEKPEAATDSVWRVIGHASGLLCFGVYAVLTLHRIISPPGTFTPVAAVAPAPPVAPKPSALKGTWTATAATIDGTDLSEEELARVLLSVVGQSFAMRIQGDYFRGALREHAEAAPKTIDLVGDDGTTWVGIFKCSGGSLDLCIIRMQGPSQRPIDFTAVEGSERRLISFKLLEGK